MSDFLVVVPEGWVEVTADWIGANYSVEEVQYMISTESWTDLEPILQHRGELPEGKHVIGATLVLMSDGYHLWVNFA